MLPTLYYTPAKYPAHFDSADTEKTKVFEEMMFRHWNTHSLLSILHCVSRMVLIEAFFLKQTNRFTTNPFPTERKTSSWPANVTSWPRQSHVCSQLHNITI
jgi:hypothetical protein